MLFRVFQHLLPKAEAWKIREPTSGWTIGGGPSIGDPGLVVGGSSQGGNLSRLFLGLANALEPIRDFFDGIFGDAFPTTTRELAAWEAQFGLVADPDESVRRLALAAEWAATGGQSPAYIQGVLQTAGFPLYVHEWWSSGPPYVARDPHDFTNIPLIGSVRCRANGAPTQPMCRPTSIDFLHQAECNRFLANDPHYLVNRNLTNNAPPPIPNDPGAEDGPWKLYPFFIYIGPETFNDEGPTPRVPISASRRNELERLLLKICPDQDWIVTLVDYV